MLLGRCAKVNLFWVSVGFAVQSSNSLPAVAPIVKVNILDHCGLARPLREVRAQGRRWKPVSFSTTSP